MQASEAARRAGAWIEAHGDPLQRQRAAALLGRGDASAVLEQIDAREDDPASLRCALAIGDDLRALDGARVARWAAAVARTQHSDGGWLPGAPLTERLFETGMLAGHLAKTRYVRPELLEAAADFLARRWSPDLVQGGSWHAIAAYAHLFSNTEHDDADAVLQWCGRELGRAFLTHRFDAVRAARVLVYCDAHGLPGAELRPQDLVLALVTEQAPAGDFPAWEGEGARDARESTLDALVALRRFGA